MAKIITIKKGLDIPLEGKASEIITQDTATELYGITPDDYPGYTWKAVVKAGDKVKAGSPLLVAKEFPELRLSSPVAGEVMEIKRGERRKIEFVSVKSDKSDLCEEIPSDLTLLGKLRYTGVFALMRQRPFDIVPAAEVIPRDIFVTAFDSAPLASNMIPEDTLKYLESGLKALSTLTDGKVYLCTPYDSQIDSQVAEVYRFKGPHPAGNVGVQIANIKPVNKGELVWTLDINTAARIGKLQETDKIDHTTIVALTGPDINNPHLVSTKVGAKLSSLLDKELKEHCGKIRLISGNVLTGVRVSEKSGFLRFPYRQITAIDEGDEADEFMGWASMNPKKYSVKHTFPAFLRGLSKPFNFDARIKGGHRAMILSGEYDKVFPFDIYPEYLIKAILAKDIEKMEQRGIYEVAPEDFALPEFVDTSKLELQKIVRDGLDYLRKETM